ncbi:MAG: ABC transporter permease subunit [Nitriliruptor sp.]|uniref:ABC transporter permease subunit n=1 Tax=Nitriliruptor sp. TaxID=2448056 RepID=UPI0034A0912A
MAETFAVLTGVVRDQRRSLGLWGAALAAVTLIYVSFYPAVGGAEMQSMVDAMPENLSAALGYDRLGSASGYLTSTVFGLLGPALLLVFGIGRGAKLVAGLEEEGGLELELTSPVSRGQVARERLLALFVSLAALVGVVVAVTIALWAVIDLEDVAVGGIASTALGLLLAFAFASLAFAAGTATGRRSVALGVGAGAAVLAYIADAIGAIVSDASWLTTLSPWSWYLGEDPLTAGVDPVGFGSLFVLAVVAAALGMAAFVRRDLCV